MGSFLHYLSLRIIGVTWNILLIKTTLSSVRMRNTCRPRKMILQLQGCITFRTWHRVIKRRSHRNVYMIRTLPLIMTLTLACFTKRRLLSRSLLLLRTRNMLIPHVVCRRTLLTRGVRRRLIRHIRIKRSLIVVILLVWLVWSRPYRALV